MGIALDRSPTITRPGKNEPVSLLFPRLSSALRSLRHLPSLEHQPVQISSVEKFSLRDHCTNLRGVMDIPRRLRRGYEIR